MDSWQQAFEVFDHVADLNPLEREEALRHECAGASLLRIKVERLLKADHQPNPLDRDISGSASSLLFKWMALAATAALHASNVDATSP